jgi:hypothetical protein
MEVVEAPGHAGRRGVDATAEAVRLEIRAGGQQ